MTKDLEILSAAWKRRENLGLWRDTNALRVFHGPGEAAGQGSLSQWSVDSYGGHFWFTHWSSKNGEAQLRSEWIEFYKASKGALSGCALLRPKGDLPEEPTTLWGAPPQGQQPFWVEEHQVKYAIRTSGHRHPGLFLDHSELRRWLKLRCSGLKVLNGFAYTGSLSVAAGVSGAAEVVTIDLSKPTIDWAKENWQKNGLRTEHSRWIVGDVFEWLGRLEKKESESFDVLILDPPSFSRGKKGTFSTQKDLTKLHQAAMPLVKKGGRLVTSINSANLSVEEFVRDVNAAARALKQDYIFLQQLQQPQSFPSQMDPASRYLKGFILERV